MQQDWTFLTAYNFRSYDFMACDFIAYELTAHEFTANNFTAYLLLLIFCIVPLKLDNVSNSQVWQ